jgi:hypothetical protein
MLWIQTLVVKIIFSINFFSYENLTSVVAQCGHFSAQKSNLFYSNICIPNLYLFSLLLHILHLWQLKISIFSAQVHNLFSFIVQYFLYQVEIILKNNLTKLLSGSLHQ